MNDQKEILTRDIVQQKLIGEAKRRAIGAALILAPILVALGLMYLLAIATTSPTSFLAIFMLVALVGAIIISGIDILYGSIQLYKARKGNFSIAVESLVKMEDFKFSIWQFLLRFDLRFPILSLLQRPYYNHIFEFESGKKFVANAYDYKETHVNTAAQISNVGEKMIVVVYNSNPDRIIMLFSPKIYNYKA